MMNGKGILAVAIILMCVGFGGVIYTVTSEAPAQTAPRPPSTVVAPVTPATPATTVTTPTLTTEEQVYLEVMLGLTELSLDVSDELRILMGNPQVSDDDWRFEVVIQVSMVRILYAEAKAIDPPSSFSSYHRIYVQSLYHWDKSCDLLLQGIDELDPDLIDEANTELEISTQLMEESTLLLDEFFESRT